MKIKKYVPNILSSIRLSSPLVLIPLITSGNYLLAFISLCGFLFTDAVDGFLARKWHVESELGAKIDAIADKLILGSLLIPLVVSNPIVVINICLEALISIVNVTRKIKGGKPKTHQLGRIKMIVISLFTALGYLGKLVAIQNSFINVLATITSFFQIGSLVGYIKDFDDEQKKSIMKVRKSQIEIDNSEFELDDEKEKVLDLNIDNPKLERIEELNYKKEELKKYRDEILSSLNQDEKHQEKVKIKTKRYI